MEDPVLDPTTNAVIKGGMWEHQRRWWDSQHFIKALVTGYGGGKTMIGAKRSISLAINNAPSPHICVSPSYKVARRTIIPTIKQLLDGKMSLRRDLSYRYNKSEFEFIIRCGDREATIWVLSGDDPDALKGPNIGSALLDEPFVMDRGVFDQVLARVRDPVAKRREICLTGTPEDLNWGYDICEGEERPNFDIEVIHATTHANRALPPDYVLRLEKGYTSRAVQAYVGGRFVSLADGLVYYGFDIESNRRDLPDPGHELEVGMDFNVDPMAAVVFWSNGDHCHIIDEIELPNADTQQMCSELHERYPGRIRTVFPDASGKSRRTSSPGGKSDFHYIREAGFTIDVGSANPLIRDRYNAVNGKLRPHVGQPTLTVSPKCRKLIHYMSAYAHSKLNDQKHMSHLLDAMGYPVARKWPVKPKAAPIRIIGV